jgi:hypothetical protein
MARFLIESPPRAPFSGLATGQYWDGATNGVTLGTRAMVADRIEIVPVMIERAGVRIDRIGVGISAAGAAGTNLRAYIYRDTGQGAPGALFHATPNLLADAAVFVEEVLAQPLALPKGLLWFAVHTQDAPTLRARAASAIPPITTTTNPAATSQFTCLQAASPFANPPPDPAPAGVLQPNALGVRVVVRLV